MITSPVVPGTFAEWRMSANDIFDPQVAVGGHQPIGHDQWSPFYNRYCVVGARIRIEAITGNTSAPLLVGVMLHDENKTINSATSALVEQGKSNYRFIQSAVNGNVPKRWGVNYSMKKWFGIQNVKDNLAQYGALFGTSPSVFAHFLIWVGLLGGVSSAAVITTVNYVIDYAVLCFEPKELTQS